jgi:hypothetical protein
MTLENWLNVVWLKRPVLDNIFLGFDGISLKSDKQILDVVFKMCLAKYVKCVDQ